VPRGRVRHVLGRAGKRVCFAIWRCVSTRGLWNDEAQSDFPRDLKTDDWLYRLSIP
jgi:hypothetical protein